MEAVATWFAPNDIPGHISYLIIAVSYYLTNIFWLRVTAVIGLSLEIAYFALTSPDLYAGISWDALFIAINLYQLYWLLRDRYGAGIEGKVGALLTQFFSGLDRAQIAQIRKCGAMREIEAGQCITLIDKPVERLFLLAEGVMQVDVHGTLISHLAPGSFIGEMAYLTGCNATATVIASEPCEVFVIQPEKLNQLCARDAQIDSAVHRLIGRDLAAKITVTNKVKAHAEAKLTGG